MNFPDQLKIAAALAEDGKFLFEAAQVKKETPGKIWVPPKCANHWAKEYLGTPKTDLGDVLSGGWWSQFMSADISVHDCWILKGIVWSATDANVASYAKLVRCLPGKKESSGLEYPCEVELSSASSAPPTPNESTGALSISPSPPIPSPKGWPKPEDCDFGNGVSFSKLVLTKKGVNANGDEFLQFEMAPGDLLDEGIKQLLSAQGVPAEFYSGHLGMLHNDADQVMALEAQYQAELHEKLTQDIKKALEGDVGKPLDSALYAKMKAQLEDALREMPLEPLIKKINGIYPPSMSLSEKEVAEFEALGEEIMNGCDELPPLGGCIGHTANLSKVDFQ